jgi:hypothetical protein
MHAFYSGQFVLPLPEGHRFPIGEYALLRARLVAELPGVAMQEAPRASDGELALAHSPDYIDALTRGSISGPAMREIAFPWSLAMVERSRRSVGASIAAARQAMTHGIAASWRHTSRLRWQRQWLLRVQRRGSGGPPGTGRMERHAIAPAPALGQGAMGKFNRSARADAQLAKRAGHCPGPSLKPLHARSGVLPGGRRPAPR